MAPEGPHGLGLARARIRLGRPRREWAQRPHDPLDGKAFDRAMHVIVYDDPAMRETGADDARARLARVLGDRRFRRNLANARNNWLGANVDKVTAGILRYFEQRGWHFPIAVPPRKRLRTRSLP